MNLLSNHAKLSSHDIIILILFLQVCFQNAKKQRQHVPLIPCI